MDCFDPFDGDGYTFPGTSVATPGSSTQSKGSMDPRIQKMALDLQVQMSLTRPPYRYDKCMLSPTKLRSLLDQCQPNEIVLRISANVDSLRVLLCAPDLSMEHAELVLLNLGEAMSNCMHASHVHLLLDVVRKSEFLNSPILQTLFEDFQCVTDEERQRFHLICKSLVVIASNVIAAFSDGELINSLVWCLHRCLALQEGGDRRFDDDVNKILGLFKPKEEETVQDGAQNVTEADGVNFKDVPVIPTVSELLFERFPEVGSNIFSGAYRSTSAYLNAHFHLLREDYVRPLRSGLRSIKGDPNILEKRSLRAGNINLYHDIQILHPDCTLEGVVHMLSFDIKPFTNFNWESSKRLIYGTLICLFRPENMNKIFFATVTSRSVNHLREGYLYVKFEDKDLSQITKIDPFDRFVMVESPAYFEAYRYSLTALKDFQGNLPFSTQLVENDLTPTMPSYLAEDTLVNLHSLIEENPTEDDQLKIGYDFFTTNATGQDPSNGENTFRLKDSLASPEKLDLNQSQFDAFEGALSSQLSLIQGPPGTGKTYVGKKIARAFIENVPNWVKVEDRQPPIFIMCNTNHALDQFLEGILPYTGRKLVRIGGRSKSEKLFSFNLQTIRGESKTAGIVESFLMNMNRSHRSAMGILKSNIHRTTLNIRMTVLGILRLEKLGAGGMEGRHYQSLLFSSEASTHSQNVYEDGDQILLKWLGFNPAYKKAIDMAGVEEKAPQVVASDSEDDSDTVVEEEANRNIDQEDNIEEPDRKEEEMREWLAISLYSDELLPEMKAELRRQVLMKSAYTAEDVRFIPNMWELSYQNRWKMYRYWRNLLLSNSSSFEIADLVSKYNDEVTKLREVRSEIDLNIMRDAAVVGTTITGAAKYKKVLSELKSPVTIIEEASMVLEGHVIASLTPSCQQLLLIGDHQQLRPTCASYDMEKGKLNISLFERLVNNRACFHQLDVQHRMRREMAHLLTPNFYPKLTSHESVDAHPPVPGVTANMFFISHTKPETASQVRSHSRFNLHEAYYLVELVRYLMCQGYRHEDITVLSAYQEQVRNIRGILKGRIERPEKVKVTTVDNFQGEENKIILLSLVRSNEEGKLGFVANSQRICVSLSRAQHGLYVMGNFNMLSQHSDIWRNIVEKVTATGNIGTSLEIFCRTHPDYVVRATNSSDFYLSPDGGCNRCCTATLRCGHKCPLYCHPTDQEHSAVPCAAACYQRCPVGHQCPKRCGEDCGGCETLIAVQKNPCNHKCRVPCYQSTDEGCPICQSKLVTNVRNDGKDSKRGSRGRGRGNRGRRR